MASIRLPVRLRSATGCASPDTYEEIVAGFRALQARDSDYNNINARGWERLAELTGALISVPDAEQAIPEMFSVMEPLLDADLGSPGPQVHRMERIRNRA